MPCWRCSTHLPRLASANGGGSNVLRAKRTRPDRIARTGAPDRAAIRGRRPARTPPGVPAWFKFCRRVAVFHRRGEFEADPPSDHEARRQRAQTTASARAAGQGPWPDQVPCRRTGMSSAAQAARRAPRRGPGGSEPSKRPWPGLQRPAGARRKKKKKKKSSRRKGAKNTNPAIGLISQAGSPRLVQITAPELHHGGIGESSHSLLDHRAVAATPSEFKLLTPSWMPVPASPCPSTARARQHPAHVQCPRPGCALQDERGDGACRVVADPGQGEERIHVERARRRRAGPAIAVAAACSLSARRCRIAEPWTTSARASPARG